MLVQKQSTNHLLFFILSGLAVVFAWLAISSPPFIFAAIGLAFSASIIRAYQRGIVKEAQAILRIVGSLILAWFLAETVGRALGFPGFLATITGFYITLFTGYLLSGLLINCFKTEEEPSIPEKILGGLVGGFEGVIVVWLLLLGLCALPNSQMASYYPRFFSRFTGPIDKMLAPVLPEQANSAVQLMKSAQRIASNFNPEKVDREALQEILTPLAEMPEIVAMQQDESLRKLVEKKDFMALLNHPALRNLLESREVQEKLKNMDWQKLERALSPKS